MEPPKEIPAVEPVGPEGCGDGEAALHARLARQSRGSGVSLPTLPLRPAVQPEHERAVALAEMLHRDLMGLHHVYAEAVDRTVGLFLRLRKESPGGDPVVAMVAALDTCERAASLQRNSIAGRIAEWRGILLDGATAEVNVYVNNLNETIERLWANEPFGQGWLVFIEHVLLGLAVAFVLRRKARMVKRGAQVAALIAACRTLRPLPRPVAEDVPIERFGMARQGAKDGPAQHPAGEHELNEALKATANAVLTPGKATGQRSRAGRIVMITSAAQKFEIPPVARTGAAAIDVALADDWDHLPIMALYRHALAAGFSHVMDRVSDRAFAAAGLELRETRAPSEPPDLKRLALEYGKRTGKPALADGRPTPHFRKFIKRRTRYTGRRVQWELVAGQGRHDADQPFNELETDRHGGHHRVKKAGPVDVPSFVSKWSDPPASPEDDLAARELLGLITRNRGLRAFAEAARDLEGASSIADRLGLTKDGANKRKAKLRALLRRDEYAV